MVLDDALLHNVTYLCMKFEVTSLNAFEVMPWTRFHDARTDGPTGSLQYTPQTSFMGV